MSVPQTIRTDQAAASEEATSLIRSEKRRYSDRGLKTGHRILRNNPVPSCFSSFYIEETEMKKRLLMGVVTGAAFLMVYGSPAFADGSSLPYNRGGMSFPVMDQVIAQYDQSRELFRIEGECRSSCTELLAIKNVCIEPSATLLFHAAIINPNHPIDPEKNRRMASYYNSKLRNFILANRYMDSWEFHPIPGRDIIRKFGYRQCPRK